MRLLLYVIVGLSLELFVSYGLFSILSSIEYYQVAAILYAALALLADSFSTREQDKYSSKIFRALTILSATLAGVNYCLIDVANHSWLPQYVWNDYIGLANIYRLTEYVAIGYSIVLYYFKKPA